MKDGRKGRTIWMDERWADGRGDELTNEGRKKTSQRGEKQARKTIWMHVGWTEGSEEC